MTPEESEKIKEQYDEFNTIDEMRKQMKQMESSALEEEMSKIKREDEINKKNLEKIREDEKFKQMRIDAENQQRLYNAQQEIMAEK